MAEVYVDFTFYQGTYLNGTQSDVEQTEFDKLEPKAEAIIREMTLSRSDSYSDGDEVKMAACAVIEKLWESYELENDSAPAEVSSEKVGGYSVTYKGNSRSERQKENLKVAREAARQWLAPTGLLFRGV